MQMKNKQNNTRCDNYKFENLPSESAHLAVPERTKWRPLKFKNKKVAIPMDNIKLDSQPVKRQNCSELQKHNRSLKIEIFVSVYSANFVQSSCIVSWVSRMLP